MPIELSNSLKSTCGWNFASKGMNGLFVSRFYTTAILTIFIIILIMVLYPCKKNTSLWVLVKLSFYIFLVSLGVIFTHDCVVYHEYERNTEQTDSEKFINSLDISENVAFQGTVDNMPVNPIHQRHSNESDITPVNVVGGDDTQSIFAMYGV